MYVYIIRFSLENIDEMISPEINNHGTQINNPNQ